MSEDLLESQVTLAALIDQDSLQRVCMTHAALFSTGLAVMDNHGQVLVDIPAEFPLCRRLGNHPASAKVCGNFDILVQAEHMDSSDAPISRPCTCGLRYEIMHICHQGEVLGRLIFGPYRPEQMVSLDAALDELLVSDDPPLDAKTLKEATSLLQRMEQISRERALQVVRSLNEVLSVIVQTGYARHLTSQIHIAAIQDAYNELTEKNRRLADSVEKLKELDKLKSNFLATVSHELRTPLTSVIGYSEMLLEGLAGELTKEQRDYIQVIMEKGDQLLQIINEVLNISRIESGTIQLVCERLDVQELMRQVRDAMTPQARRKEIVLEHHAPEALPPVWADRAKTRQILLNLLSNAIKFTPRGGTVAISAEEVRLGSNGELGATSGARPALLVRVRDSGIGIPAEAREKVFDTFFQVDSSSTREFGGTGLGLSIVKNFVEAHGGKVWVEDQLQDQGTSIAFVLPVNPPQSRAGRQAAPRSQMVG